MATYQYKAMQGDGSTKVGEVDAGGRQDAMQMLEGLGLVPLKIAEVAAAPTPGMSRGGLRLPVGKWGFQSKRVPFSALEDFTRSLSSLLTAGVPLSRALTILYKETSNAAAGAKWK